MRAHLKLSAHLPSSLVVAVALLASNAFAQVAVPAKTADQARAAEVTDPASPSAGEEQRGDAGEIIVTGSRIQRAGFNAPTPTTVLGALELRQGDPVSVAQVFDESPSFVRLPLRPRRRATPTTAPPKPIFAAWVPSVP